MATWASVLAIIVVIIILFIAFYPREQFVVAPSQCKPYIVSGVTGVIANFPILEKLNLNRENRFEYKQVAGTQHLFIFYNVDSRSLFSIYAGSRNGKNFTINDKGISYQLEIVDSGLKFSRTMNVVTAKNKLAKGKSVWDLIYNPVTTTVSATINLVEAV
jgi:hypothetical protein